MYDVSLRQCNPSLRDTRLGLLSGGLGPSRAKDAHSKSFRLRMPFFYRQMGIYLTTNLKFPLFKRGSWGFD